MPSTYSPSLRLELIASGEQSGTWGTTTNTNLGTLLEQSIVGVQSITMFNANYTLSNYNGVSDEARQAVLVVSGTNAAVRDIITPLAPKIYIIKNNTTGGFAINVRAATGSSVSIPNGATYAVYCDGTNFNLALTQTLAAAGTGISITTVGSTSTVSFGPITSAQLAAALTDETGTGANVFATSPTLVTPNLGTPSTLVGTNITGTAAGLTAGTVTTNANLTGAITSGGNATSLGSFTSAQLASALTDETGTGANVFNTNPSITSATLVTPILGTPQSGNFSTGTFTWPTFNQNTTGSSGSCTGNAATVTNGIYTTNYSSYSPTLTGGGASGTWGINVTGSSGSCTGNAATVTNGITTTNYNSYSPTLTGGGASGTWGINAATATTATNQSGGTVNATTITGSSDATINGVRVGRGVGNHPYNTAVGAQAINANTTGMYNTVVGISALKDNTVGSYNTVIGANSLESMNTTFTSSASDNVVIGRSALSQATYSDNNVVIGAYAMYATASGGSYNVVVGEGAYTTGTGSRNTMLGRGITSGTGDDNICIGYGAGTSLGALTGVIAIGNNILARASNNITLGNDTSYIWNAYGTNATWTRVSDERLKTNIQSADIGLSFINRLDVKTYNWRPSYDIPKELKAYSEENKQDTNTVMYGMLAQDVKAALDVENIEHFAGWDVDSRDGTQAISLEMFVLPLINSIKELTARLEALESKNNGN